MTGHPLTALFGYYSIFPFFASLVLLYAAAATPLFRAADTPPIEESKRVRTLDGLRGYLALGVFFEHVGYYHQFLVDRQWTPTPSGFYNSVGRVAVGFFFMITGYLFWSRLVRRQGHIDWTNLYVGRVFRIGPLFLVTFAIVVLVVMVRTGFVMQESIASFLRQVGSGLSLGLLHIPEINHYPQTTLLLDGVTWTLGYEWVFYLSLPLLAIVARRPRFQVPVVAGLLALCLAAIGLHLRHNPSAVLACVTLFLMGMLTGSLQHRQWLGQLSGVVRSLIVAAFLGSVFFFTDPFSFVPLLLMGCCFYLICCDCTVFGLLTTRPAYRLGNISYGIYLLQGLPQALIFRTFKTTMLASPQGQWALALAAAFVLLIAATVAHVLVERPGIEAGKQLLLRIRPAGA